MDREARAGLPESVECRRAYAVLEEELLGDGQLAAEQRDLLEEHLASCSACEEYAEFVRRMPELAPAPSSAEVSRATVGARKIYFTRRKRSRLLAGSIAAIAAAAAVLLFIQLFPTGPEDPATGSEIELLLASGSVDLGQPFASSGVLEALGREVVALEHATRLEAGDLATIGLSERAKIEPLVLEHDAVELRLQRGMVAVHIPVDRSQSVRFAVRTSRATVTVTGTVFAVEVIGDDVRVDVVRGKVEVRPKGKGAGKAIEIGAGHSLTVARGSTAALDAATHERILELVGIGGLLRQPEEPKDPPAEPEPAPERAEPDDPPRQPGVVGATGKPSASAKASGNVEPPAGNDLEGLLTAARTCRADRDWTCAAVNLQQAIDRYPGQPQAKTALVSLAEIQLRHLGRAGKALNNFERYRIASPGGPLAEEALYGVCRALRSLERAAAEQRSLEQFLEQHPSSLRAPKARARLEQLSSTGE